jgi:hypothetical protein
VAPVGRGVTLLDLEDRPTVDEAIETVVAARYGPVSGWLGTASVRIEIIEPLPDEAF